MPNHHQLKNSLFGYNKEQVHEYLRKKEQSYSQNLMEKDNIIEELTNRCQTIQQDLDIHKEQSLELVNAKEQISRTLLDTTTRMNNKMAEANRHAEQIIQEAEEKADVRMREADHYDEVSRKNADEYADRIKKDAEEYHDNKISEADRIALSTTNKAREDYDSKLEEARQKSEQLIAEAYAFAEKEKSGMEKQIEEKRENLVSLKQAAKALKDDARAAMGLFELKIHNAIEKANQDKSDE